MIKIFGVEYISDKEAAARYGYSSSWFSHKRLKKGGPPFYRNDKGRVLYQVKEMDEWFKSKLVRSE